MPKQTLSSTRQMPARPRRISALKEGYRTRKRGLLMGSDMSDGDDVRLQMSWLRTHLHLIGPTNSGKSRVLLWLYQLLCYTDRPLILIDPKGALFRMARDWALANGFAKRVVLLDFSSDVLPTYNPLRPNGLRIDLQSQWVREGVRSAWGASTFDSTPLLARTLYLALYTARAMECSFMEALDVLRPSPALRHAALRRITDPFVHGALLAFDKLSDRVKAEQASSTISRLEMFLCDEVVRTVICGKQSLDLEDLLKERRIILVNFGKYQPLMPDTLKLIGRMFFNDLLAHVYKLHGDGVFDEDHPCYVICDEVQNFATRQLCDSLDEGRGIGFHCAGLAHQHLSQLVLEDQSGFLLRSMLTDARTKIIFGDLDFEDLEILAKNVALDQFNPWPREDQIGKTVRVITTRSRSGSRGRGLSLPQSITDSKSQSDSVSDQVGGSTAVSNTTSDSVTNSTEASESFSSGDAWHEATSVAHSRGSARNWSDTTSTNSTDTTNWSDGQNTGSHWADGQSSAETWNEGTHSSEGVHDGIGFTLPADSTDAPDIIHYSQGTTSTQGVSSGVGGMRGHTHTTGGSSGQTSSFGGAHTDAYGHAVSTGGNETENETLGHTQGHTHNRAVQRGRSAGLAVLHGQSRGVTDTASWAETESHTDGTSHAVSRGRTPSMSEEIGWSESQTLQPLPAEEQTLLQIQRLKALPKMCFTLKVPGKPTLFVRAPWVDTPKITRRTLEAGLARVHSLPFYTRLGQHGDNVIDVEVQQMPPASRAASSKQLARPVPDKALPSPTPDDELVFWQPAPAADRGGRRENS